jgi:hypothetical protein
MIKKKVINYIAMMVRNDMKVCSKFRWAPRSVHGKNLNMTKSDRINYLRSNLIMVNGWQKHC